MQQMSPLLQREVTSKHCTWIKDVPYFAQARSAFVVALVNNAQFMLFLPQERVRTCDELKVVMRGMCSFQSKVLARGGVWGADFVLGYHSAQPELKRLRSNTWALSLTYLEVMLINSAALEFVVRSFPTEESAIDRYSRRLAARVNILRVAAFIKHCGGVDAAFRAYHNPTPASNVRRFNPHKMLQRRWSAADDDDEDDDNPPPPPPQMSPRFNNLPPEADDSAGGVFTVGEDDDEGLPRPSASFATSGWDALLSGEDGAEGDDDDEDDEDGYYGGQGSVEPGSGVAFGKPADMGGKDAHSAALGQRLSRVEGMLEQLMSFHGLPPPPAALPRSSALDSSSVLPTFRTSLMNLPSSSYTAATTLLWPPADGTNPQFAHPRAQRPPQGTATGATTTSGANGTEVEASIRLTDPLGMFSEDTERTDQATSASL